MATVSRVETAIVSKRGYRTLASTAPDYPVGSIKFHPDYPNTPTIAMRTKFSDNDSTSCTSWQTVNGAGDGSNFALDVQVGDWPDTAPGVPAFPEPEPEPEPVPEPEFEGS